jgi:predicted O-methyltransferase YrrM
MIRNIQGQEINSNIPGWSRYVPNYKRAIEQAQDGFKLAEIGCYLGAGVIYAAQFAKSINKNIQIYAIDTWRGSNELEHKQMIQKLGGEDAFYHEFLKNIQTAGVQDVINVIRKTSLEASTFFEDNSLDFVLIDAGHDYIDVRSDIVAWYRKVKIYGTLAGHDIAHPPVKRAVEEIFGTNYDDKDESWLIKKWQK